MKSVDIPAGQGGVNDVNHTTSHLTTSSSSSSSSRSSSTRISTAGTVGTAVLGCEGEPVGQPELPSHRIILTLIIDVAMTIEYDHDIRQDVYLHSRFVRKS